MTRFPVPEFATATNNDSSGAQITEIQLLLAAELRVVQVVPLELVMTRLPVPEDATVTNLETSGDQHIENHVLSAAEV